MRQFFRTLTTFALALFCLSTGALATVLPLSANARSWLSARIQTLPFPTLFVGLALLIVGCLLLASWRLGLKTQLHYIKAGKRSVAIDENLIDSYLKVYWKERFPDQEIESQISLHRNQIHFLVHFPPATEERQKEILAQLQNEIEELLTRYLGYREPFRLVVSFGE